MINLMLDTATQQEGKSLKSKHKSQRRTCCHRQESHKNTKAKNDNIYTKGILRTHTYPVLATSVSVTSYVPCLDDSVGVLYPL